MAHFGCFVVVLWGMTEGAVRLKRTLSRCSREKAATRGRGERLGRVFSGQEAVAGGKRGPRRCAKTQSRPPSSRFATVMVEQPTQPFTPRPPQRRSGGRALAGVGAPPGARKFPSSFHHFVFVNRSDLKTTGRGLGICKCLCFNGLRISPRKVLPGRRVSLSGIALLIRSEPDRHAG